MDPQELAVAVAAALEHRGIRGDVTDLRQLSGGASRDTWSFELVDSTDRRGMILQRARPGGIRTGVGTAGEARLVRAARAAGVPAPAVVAWSDAPDEIAETWTVTERLAGETIPRRVQRSLDDRAADRLTRQLGRAAAAIGRIDASGLGHLHDEDQVDQFRELLTTTGEPSAAFELGLRWLEDNRPDPVPPTVVHGDLRLGNLIVDDTGLVAVIDWELAHRGDPVEDLAWPCVRAWRFGGPAPVGGFGDRETLYAAYEEASGTAVDRRRAHWWEALSTLKWGVMCIVQAQTHLSGLHRSVELAAIGRRVCENEYDLMRLTHPHLARPAGVESNADAPAPPAPGLHGRPTILDLVEGVREFLGEDVVPATDDQVRFHARVAANVLAIVERELRAGDGPEREHVDALSRTGLTSDEELAGAVRRGTLDHRRDEVEQLVWRTVLAKLAVANPAYLIADDDPA